MHLPPYPTYQSSGIDWLGDVPAHWRVKKLKYLISSITGGGTPATENEAYWGGDIPWVSPKDMKVARIASTEDYITEEALRSSATSLIKAGTVLLVVRSGILKHSLPVAINEVSVALNQDMKALEPAEEINAPFLYWLFKGHTEMILTFCSKLGATVDSIELDQLLHYRLPYPPLSEQQAIAAYLDEKTAQIDQLIAAKQRLMALLREEKAALIQQAVTQGLDAAAPRKPSGIEWLGDVPAHWEVKYLKYVAEVRTGIAKGKAYSAGEKLVQVPYLRVANVQDGYLALDEILTINASATEAVNYRLEPLDILMNEGGDNDKLGRGTVWHGEIPNAIHQNHVFAIRPTPALNSYFLSYYVGSASCKNYFLIRGKQTTNLASISSSAIATTPLALPPIEEQAEIVAYLNAKTAQIETTLTQITRELDLLAEYRTALISEVVTGKVDVRNATSSGGRQIQLPVSAEALPLAAEEAGEYANGKQLRLF